MGLFKGPEDTDNLNTNPLRHGNNSVDLRGLLGEIK